MSAYDDNQITREYIDERMREINESVYPIINGTDCTMDELRAGIRREKQLRREIKAKDKEFYDSTFEI